MINKKKSRVASFPVYKFTTSFLYDWFDKILQKRLDQSKEKFLKAPVVEIETK